jgi:hypothetical protein
LHCVGSVGHHSDAIAHAGDRGPDEGARVGDSEACVSELAKLGSDKVRDMASYIDAPARILL